MGKPRINITFTEEEYKMISLLSAREDKSMGQYVRERFLGTMKITANEDNLDVIRKVISREIKAQLEPAVDRLASLAAKTCIISATSVNMTAQMYSEILPSDAISIQDIYKAARIKAVHYIKDPNSQFDFENGGK